jgi:hypothetical protein
MLCMGYVTYVWTRFSSVFNVNGVGSRTQSAKNRDGVCTAGGNECIRVICSSKTRA